MIWTLDLNFLVDVSNSWLCKSFAKIMFNMFSGRWTHGRIPFLWPC